MRTLGKLGGSDGEAAVGKQINGREAQGIVVRVLIFESWPPYRALIQKRAYERAEFVLPGFLQGFP